MLWDIKLTGKAGRLMPFIKHWSGFPFLSLTCSGFVLCPFLATVHVSEWAQGRRENMEQGTQRSKGSPLSCCAELDDRPRDKGSAGEERGASVLAEAQRAHWHARQPWRSTHMTLLGHPAAFWCTSCRSQGAPHSVPQLSQTGAAEAFREWADGPWTPPLASVTSCAQGGGKDMGAQLPQIDIFKILSVLVHEQMSCFLPFGLRVPQISY